MSDVLFEIIGSIGLVGMGIAFLVYSYRLISADEVSTRVQKYVTDQSLSNKAAAELSRPVLTGTFFERTIFAGLENIGEFLSRFAPSKSIEETNRMLTVAKNPYKLKALEFYAIRIIVFAFGIWFSLFIGSRTQIASQRVMIIAVTLIAYYIIPVIWLRMVYKRNQKEIQKSLPDVLDMLSVCATAGLGFDQAMQRVSQHWDSQIGQEFGKVISEMEVGLSRRDALHNFATRMDISELSAFVSVILQSELLGMSIADTLRIQAEQMRIQRRFRAQEEAQKLPAKMIVPLAFLILPALMAVILGPSVATIMEVF